MKKFFAILVAICLMTSALCISTSALTVSTDDVIRIHGLKKDGTLVLIDGSKSFEAGWEKAVDYAENHEYMDENEYYRIVVDFLADWNANEKGEFGDSDGDGFQFSTIYVPSDTRMTLNLNGHTIDRDLKAYELDGEVICINDDADVIINDGTITGGWSSNGAGGIHMQEDSKLTLNNVNIVGNSVDDDDGAGIAVDDGASLTMNGGCVSHNVSYNDVYGGGVYVDNGSAVFTDVTFENNQGFEQSTQGAAVYVNEGTLSMDGCKVIGNGLMLTNNGTTCLGAYSIIDISNGSKVTITDTEFSENGYAQETYVSHNLIKYTSVISSKASYLTLNKCIFSDNNQVYMIESEATAFNAFDSDLSQNKSFAFYGNCAGGFGSAFTNCKFSYSGPLLGCDYTFFFNVSSSGLSFVDCNFGNATFNNKSAAQFVDTSASNEFSASMFGEGSLAVLVSFIALIASIAAIGVNVASYKKRKKETVKNEAE